MTVHTEIQALDWLRSLVVLAAYSTHPSRIYQNWTRHWQSNFRWSSLERCLWLVDLQRCHYRKRVTCRCRRPLMTLKITRSLVNEQHAMRTATRTRWRLSPTTKCKGKGYNSIWSIMIIHISKTIHIGLFFLFTRSRIHLLLVVRLTCIW